MRVGACGICCETCGLFTKEICPGCEKTEEHVRFLRGINANCPVLECAVKNKVDVCSRDCDRFPCEKFRGWPLVNDWLEMFKNRLKSKK